MFGRLLLLFTVVPLVELALLIEVGRKIGVMNTVVIVIITGVTGAALARAQGFQVINRIQGELSQGQLPGDSLIDGVLVLAGALLLLTPGLVTDVFGFCILVPFTRLMLKSYLKDYFREKMNKGEIVANYKIEK